jgi:putative nucleotidyltransferase with HDIG domain
MITNEDIERLFAEMLTEISDPELRERTVRVWVNACEKGNWKHIDDIRKIPFTLLTDTHGIGLVEHTLAVTVGARELARAQLDECNTLPYTIDLDRVIAGGLLHDVGKLLEIEPDGRGGYRKSHNGRCTRHPISGAILASREGLPDEIVNIIACHSKEGDGRPQTVETVLVHQADFAVFDPLVLLAKGNLI